MTQHKTLADQIHDIYKQLPDCGLKTHLAQWFELRGASQFVKKDKTEETPGELPSYIFESDEQERIAGYIKWCAKQKKEVVSSDVETPISKAILEFERLKEKAPSIRDMVYLDGVLAVLDTMKDYESDFLIKLQSTQQPAIINWMESGEILKWFNEKNRTTNIVDCLIGFQAALKEHVNCVDLVGFVNWTNDIGKCGYYPTYEYVKDDDPIFVNWCNRFNEEDMVTTEQLLQIYLASKTNPNGQAE